MDPLSDFLPAMRVERAVYTRVEATAPWGFDFNAYHHTKFGLVLQGRCWIDVAGAPRPVALNAGDCYLLPRGDAFTLRDDPGTLLVNFEEVLPRLDGRVLRYGGGGAATTVMGGRFIFAGQRRPPLLEVLPPLVYFTVSAAELNSLQATLQLLASETTEPALGSSLVVDRLADIFFVQTLRAYVGSNSGNGASGARVRWLQAVADQQIARALHLMHRRATEAWTLESLAATVGLSRSVFAQRFKGILGETPIDYLTRCRMQRAARLLEESNLPIPEVASQAGYESDSAFHKAFKRHTGHSPGRYRERQGSALHERKLTRPFPGRKTAGHGDGE